MLMGQSRAMHELRAMIHHVAPTEANVLILGENGVGKELVARAIHACSPRKDANFGGRHGHRTRINFRK